MNEKSAVRRALDVLCGMIGPGSDVLLAADAEYVALLAERQQLRAALERIGNVEDIPNVEADQIAGELAAIARAALTTEDTETV